ncbi:g3875 [Coccomyxa viridis]|uniref:RING-type E3 ubiquitin transferase n=1 Tax=Coccomyxa viridis TaxID=1274662 RepID=A0ABP1FNU5_9CHLO
MKYAQYLKALESDAPPEWRGRFLGYKRLKKAIKHLSAVAVSTESEGERQLPQDATFFALVHKEVLSVNKHFAYAARTIIRLSRKDSKKQDMRCCMHLGMRKSLVAHAHSVIDVNDLVARAEWCRRYAQINSVGLRKILKKHDKMCKNKAGQNYMQELWCGTKRMDGTFLHSPLLDELKSLEIMLMRQAYRQRMRGQEGTAEGSVGSSAAVQSALETAPSVTVNLPSQGPAKAERVELPMLPSLAPGNTIEQFPGSCKNLVRAPSDAASEVARAVSATERAICEELRLGRVSVASSGLGSQEEVDPDYQCPICLEAMFRPLGLECGHRFCADCALTCAGKGRALGSVRAILDHVHPEAACPECRTPGVFVFAIELPETEKLIKQRYPKVWAERAAEAAEKQQHLKDLLAIQRANRDATARSF